MNIVWHIIQKDLRRIAWLLAIWCACGIYIALPDFRVSTAALFTGRGGFLPLILLVAYGVTMVAMIVEVIQEDHPIRNSFWRTRPVSPTRLLGAKLLLLGVLFGVIQLLIQYGVRAALHESESLVRVWSGEPWWWLAAMRLASTLLPVASGVVILAAIAACSQNGSRFLLVLIACWVSTTALSAALEKLEIAQLPRQLTREILPTKLLVMGIYGGAMAGAVLCCQYFWRRTVVSYFLLGTGVLGLAAISQFWRWQWI